MPRQRAHGYLDQKLLLLRQCYGIGTRSFVDGRASLFSGASAFLSLFPASTSQPEARRVSEIDRMLAAVVCIEHDAKRASGHYIASYTLKQAQAEATISSEASTATHTSVAVEV